VGELTTVRRAFHTLKGSSRMVGLRDYGEAAWACEQLYNARLAQSPRMDDDLAAFTRDALQHLAAGPTPSPMARPQRTVPRRSSKPPTACACRAGACRSPRHAGRADARGGAWPAGRGPACADGRPARTAFDLPPAPAAAGCAFAELPARASSCPSWTCPRR
jgi:hypothetical protein